MVDSPSRLASLLDYQQGLCFFCHRPLPIDLASVDHLIPRCLGGFDHRVNLVVCCRAINRFFGPIPFDLKMQLIADKQFITGISRWCQAVSACPERTAGPLAPARHEVAPAGRWYAQTASHAVHYDSPSHDMHDDSSHALFQTE